MDKTRTLEPGTIIDNRYEIVSPLGRGGFATVYRAHHLQLDREVALKVLDPIAFGTPENFIQRFMSEARIVANLKHPNIVMIYDFGVVKDEQPYLAMEFLDGHDLEVELEKNGPLSPDRARKLFLGVLDALDIGHQKSVVHKDLKPSNLYLVEPGTPNEKLIVLDYGIAHVADSDNARLTKTGGYTGTPAYMPPEYIQHSVVSPTNDVYQMALIIAEAVTGKQVVNAATSVAYMVAHLGGDHHVEPWLDETQWGHVIRRALTVEHTQRYQDAGELRRAFAAAQIPLQGADINPTGMTMAPGSISNQMLAAEQSDAQAIRPSTQPESNRTPRMDVSASPIASGPQPGKVPSHLANTKPEQAKLAPTVPESVPNHASQVSHPAHPSQSANPSQNDWADVPVAQPGYGYAQYQQPKKKRRWPWVLLFLFLFCCFAVVAVPIGVVYFYYGGWDEYALAWQDYGERQIDSMVEEVVPDDFPTDFPTDISSIDPIKLAHQLAPNPEAQKLQSLLQSRYMIYHTMHFVHRFHVSAENWGFAEKSRLSLPGTSRDMMETGVQFLRATESLPGGSKKLNVSINRVAEDAMAFADVVEELNDYYEIDEGHKRDKGVGGQHLAKSVRSTGQMLNKSFTIFETETERFYTDYFKQCVRKHDDRDQFIADSCNIMLEAQHLSLEAKKGRSIKPALARYRKALSRFEKTFKSNRSALDKRFQMNAHTSFRTNAREVLQEAREWSNSKPFGAPKGKKALPDAPFFVFMERNFLMQSFVQMLNTK